MGPGGRPRRHRRRSRQTTRARAHAGKAADRGHGRRSPRTKTVTGAGTGLRQPHAARKRTFRMDSEAAFNAMFWTLLIVMLLMRFWFAFRVWRTGERIRADRAARRREGFWAHVVAYLFLLLLVALAVYVLFLNGSLRSFAFPAPDWLRWTGLGLGIASVGLFVWTHVVLGRFWSPYVQLRPAHRLITAGPYARIRHPMYSAIVGWMISLGLVAANWIPLACAALGALQFLLRIGGEESMMLQHFDDEYREYMKRTGRLLPRLIRARAARI